MLWRGLVLAVALTLSGAASAWAASDVGVTGFPPPPLTAGQSEVLLNGASSAVPSPPPLNSWYPVSGSPVKVVLWSRPLLRPSSQLNAYVALQSPEKPCAVSASADHARLLTQGQFYTVASSVNGVYSLSFTQQVTLAKGPYVRACVWFARSVGNPVIASSQLIPLINGLFGSTMTSLGGPPVDVEGEAYSVGAAYLITGTPDVTPEPLPSGGPAGFGEGPCVNTTFTFSYPGGPADVDYNCQEGIERPPVVEHIGACLFNIDEFSPQEFTLADWLYYIQAQGCTVDYLQPNNNDIAAIVATIDGGEASIAPFGTHVDLSVPADLLPHARLPGSVPDAHPVPAPPGSDCNPVTSIAPKLGSAEKKLFNLPSLSSEDLPIAVTFSASLGAVGVCTRAIEDAAAQFRFAPPELAVQGAYTSGRHAVVRTGRYSFSPLGWQVPSGSGAEVASRPTIEWSNATTPSLIPSLDLTYNQGGPPDVTLDLISVPVSDTTATLISHGQSYLSATAGPSLFLGLKLDRKKLEELTAAAIALGMTATDAASYVTAELEDELDSALVRLAPELAPPGPLSIQGYEPTTGDVVAEVDSELESQYGSESTVEAQEAETAAEDAVEDNIIEIDFSDAAAVAGDFVEDVGPVVLAAAADAGHLTLRTPPATPRLVTTSGGLRRLNAIVASALQRIRPSALRRAPLPKDKIAAAVHAALGLPVLSDVGALAVNTNRLQPGGRLSLIALGLGAGSDHAAALVLDGPHYHATRLLHVHSGETGATIRLPHTLAAGRWTIAVEDLSGVTTSANGEPAGAALVRMGILTVVSTARR